MMKGMAVPLYMGTIRGREHDTRSSVSSIVENSREIKKRRRNTNNATAYRVA